MVDLAARCSLLAVARIAWVEAHAALSRRVREKPTDQGGIDLARNRLARQWPDYLTIELTPHLAERAASLADLFALRAYDSVQLASAEFDSRALGEPVNFACFDRRLARAGEALGLAANA